MSDYISREAMSEKPKCPGCGADMELMRLLCNATFYYACPKCGWDSPTGIDSESAFRMAMRRTEPKNRVLTLEEATGSDEPVWLEAMSRVFIADVCVAPDARMAQIQTIGKASCEYLPLCDYGVLWRCWLRKPTEAEMRETPWEGDSHE